MPKIIKITIAHPELYVTGRLSQRKVYAKHKESRHLAISLLLTMNLITTSHLLHAAGKPLFKL